MQNPRDAVKIIQKWRGRIVDGNTRFVTFKRNPNRFNYYPRNYNRYGNNRNSIIMDINQDIKNLIDLEGIEDLEEEKEEVSKILLLLK